MHAVLVHLGMLPLAVPLRELQRLARRYINHAPCGYLTFLCVCQTQVIYRACEFTTSTTSICSGGILPFPYSRQMLGRRVRLAVRFACLVGGLIVCGRMC